MLRERGIGALDLRIVEARLDDGHLGVVRHQELGHAADGFQGAGMGRDPVRQALRPRCFRIGKARRTQHRHEYLCRAPLAGEPVHNDRHRVAGVVHEQLLARGVGLAHDHRQLGGERPVQLTKAAVAQAVRLLGDVLLPEDGERHVLALQLAVDRGPVRLRPPRRAGFGAALAVKPLLKPGVAELFGQRPVHARGAAPPERRPHRRRRLAGPPRGLPHGQLLSRYQS